MSTPCQAKCRNQRNNRCQLEDERIRQSRVEFGEDWDPVKHCSRYRPRSEEESERSQSRQKRKRS